MSLHALALPLILALGALALAWSVVPCRCARDDDRDRGFTGSEDR